MAQQAAMRITRGSNTRVSASTPAPAIRCWPERCKERRQDGRQAIAEKGMVQTGIGNVIAFAGIITAEISAMPDHSRKGQRHDGDDGCRCQKPVPNSGQRAQTRCCPTRWADRLRSGGTARRKSTSTQRSRNCIAHHNAQQNRNDLDHAAPPNITDDDNGHSDKATMRSWSGS